MSLNDWMEAAKTAATIIALIVGGFWTYLLFVKKREKYPKAKINHRIITASLTDDKHLLHVCVKVKNIGGVLLSLESGEVWIQQVLPVATEVSKKLNGSKDPVNAETGEIDWPEIGYKELNLGTKTVEIEPKEDEEFHLDFIIDNSIRVAQIYSYFKNETKRRREIGWSTTTIHDLTQQDQQKEGRKEEEDAGDIRQNRSAKIKAKRS